MAAAARYRVLADFHAINAGKSFWISISIVQKEGGLILYFYSCVNTICSRGIEFIRAGWDFGGASLIKIRELIVSMNLCYRRHDFALS